jgi:IS605 OrfB family transposase
MRITFRYRLWPTKAQETAMRYILEECRWLYNHLLEERKRAWEERRESLTLFEQQKTFGTLKTARPSLRDVHSQVLQNVAARLDLAFKAFFRRVRAGEQPGYPRFRTILVENLSVHRMIRNPRLAKSISDAAWAQFTGYLTYKAACAGGRVLRVNPAYTNQTCSACGNREKLTLADRTFRCPCCGMVLDRDHNASLNILALGLQGIGASP